MRCEVVAGVKGVDIGVPLRFKVDVELVSVQAQPAGLYEDQILLLCARDLREEAGFMLFSFTRNLGRLG